MACDISRERLNWLTRSVIGCAQEVCNCLGSGFLEKVYENALAFELREHGLNVLQQHRIVVRYRGIVVGEYFSDLLVNNQLLVEIKAVSALDSVHHAQCMNYLRATNLRICLLLNFGRPKLDVRRIVVGF
jgi:GxxExxY protein